ncbi:MAG: hypothetical protein WKF67_15020, partial [Rubrobacteraceae bacterium]
MLGGGLLKSKESFVCIALGLLLALLSFQTPGETAPANSSIPRDTDGDVSVKGRCEPNGNPEWGGEWVGRYEYKTIRDDAASTKEIQGSIYLNICRMDDLEFTREDKLGVLRHEKAHSLG